MKVYDWTCFSKRLIIKATAHQLFNLLTTQDGMESWFLRKCEFTRDGNQLDSRSNVREGDQYFFLWHGWTDETFEAGRWLETKPNTKLGFTFNGNNATRMEVCVKRALFLKLLLYFYIKQQKLHEIDHNINYFFL